MNHASVFALVCCSALAVAQEPAADAAPAPIPAAQSPEARALLAKALDKLEAYGRGRFSTTLEQDQAMLRNVGLPFGGMGTDVDGGWHRGTIWGDFDGRKFVLANGRMLADVDGQWQLRRDKLSGGVQLPFVFDPGFLVDVLKGAGGPVLDPVHVEADTLRGERVVILTTRLTGDAALDFADSGAVPEVGGCMGGVIRIAGIGGAGLEPPRTELDTYVAFWIAADSADLMRFAVKCYSTDAMAGQIRVAVQGAGGGAAEQEEEEEVADEGDAAPGGEPTWKRGFPATKPGKDQSVTTYRVDFEDLGLAKAPELSEASKALLRLR